MDQKIVIGLVLAVAVLAACAGFVLGSSGGDPPVEEDGRVSYVVSEYFDHASPDGTMVIRVSFSADPVKFQLYYMGVQLADPGWQHGNYSVNPDTLNATPSFLMPFGVGTYDQLVEHLEVRSQYVDLVPGAA